MQFFGLPEKFIIFRICIENNVHYVFFILTTYLGEKEMNDYVTTCFVFMSVCLFLCSLFPSVLFFLCISLSVYLALCLCLSLSLSFTVCLFIYLPITYLTHISFLLPLSIFFFCLYLQPTNFFRFCNSLFVYLSLYLLIVWSFSVFNIFSFISLNSSTG